MSLVLPFSVGVMMGINVAQSGWPVLFLHAAGLMTGYGLSWLENNWRRLS